MFENLDMSIQVYRLVRPEPARLGNPDAERFDNAVRKTFTASKKEMRRREAGWQKTNGKKPAKGL
jgi:hypothetical protein